MFPLPRGPGKKHFKAQDTGHEGRRDARARARARADADADRDQHASVMPRQRGQNREVLYQAVSQKYRTSCSAPCHSTVCAEAEVEENIGQSITVAEAEGRRIGGGSGAVKHWLGIRRQVICRMELMCVTYAVILQSTSRSSLAQGFLQTTQISACTAARGPQL